MTLMGTLRTIATSPMSRAVALAIALMLAFACVAAVAHAAGDRPAGCPQIKLEGRWSPAPFVDAAVLPGRFDPGEPAMLARVVHADNPISPPSVSSSRAAPRAPPTA
jgi:hypothetical protein